jgi:hypothetical protein
MGRSQKPHPQGKCAMSSYALLCSFGLSIATVISANAQAKRSRVKILSYQSAFAVGLVAQRIMPRLNTVGGATDLSGELCAPSSAQWAVSSHALARAVVQNLIREGSEKYLFVTTGFALGNPPTKVG